LFRNVIKIVVAAALLIAADMVFEVNFPIVREINIDTEKLEKGKAVTLLQITDFHGGPSDETVKRLIKALGNIKLDTVLITGDLVDRSTENFDNVYALIKELRSICPSIFFVSGNHEWSNDRKKELLVKLKDMGVVIINNRGSSFAASSADINICGVDDAYGRMDNIEKAMKSVNSNKYTVLLSHSPKIRQRLGGYSPDLILCGHTHGGQVRFPFIGAIIEPGEGFFPYFDKGMFKLKGNSLLYIDSGVGTSKLPIRLLNRSQVSIIRIKGR
jgi:uncharacterized protein